MATIRTASQIGDAPKPRPRRRDRRRRSCQSGHPRRTDAIRPAHPPGRARVETDQEFVIRETENRRIAERGRRRPRRGAPELNAPVVGVTARHGKQPPARRRGQCRHRHRHAACREERHHNQRGKDAPNPVASRVASLLRANRRMAASCEREAPRGRSAKRTTRTYASGHALASGEHPMGRRRRTRYSRFPGDACTATELTSAGRSGVPTRRRPDERGARRPGWLDVSSALRAGPVEPQRRSPVGREEEKSGRPRAAGRLDRLRASSAAGWSCGGDRRMVGRTVLRLPRGGVMPRWNPIIAVAVTALAALPGLFAGRPGGIARAPQGRRAGPGPAARAGRRSERGIITTLVGHGGRRCNQEGCFGASGRIVRVGRRQSAHRGLGAVRDARAPGRLLSLGADQLTALPDGRLATAISAEFEGFTGELPPEVPRGVRAQANLVIVSHGGRKEIGADLAAPEFATDPDGEGSVSNPYESLIGQRSTSLTQRPMIYWRSAAPSTVNVLAEPPSRRRLAVGPRRARSRPDGALYVGEYTGGNQARGSARNLAAGARPAPDGLHGASVDHGARVWAGRKPVRDGVLAGRRGANPSRRHPQRPGAASPPLPRGNRGGPRRQRIRVRLDGRRGGPVRPPRHAQGRHRADRATQVMRAAWLGDRDKRIRQRPRSMAERVRNVLTRRLRIRVVSELR